MASLQAQTIDDNGITLVFKGRTITVLNQDVLDAWAQTSGTLIQRKAATIAILVNNIEVNVPNNFIRKAEINIDFDRITGKFTSLEIING